MAGRDSAPIRGKCVAKDTKAWLTNPNWLREAILRYATYNLFVQPKPCQITDLEPSSDGLVCVLNDSASSIGCKLEMAAVDAWRSAHQSSDTTRINGTAILIAKGKYTVKLNQRLNQFVLSVSEFAQLTHDAPQGVLLAVAAARGVDARGGACGS